MVLLLYLIHLLVPAVVLLDLAWAWHDGYFSAGDSVGLTVKVAAVGAGLWLAAGVGALLIGERQAFLRKVSGLLVSFYTSSILLVFGELAARALHGQAQSRKTFIRKPGSDLVNVADAQVTPGASGRKHFSINDIGLRGPSIPRVPDAYRIVAAGGSTTECWYLDDLEEWPHLLMSELNRRQARLPIWVGNAGYSGHTTVHTRFLLESVRAVQDAEMLILLVGINDLQATLEREGAPTDKALESAATRFLSGASTKHCNSPDYHVPLVLRSRLYKDAVTFVRSALGRPEPKEVDLLEAEHWYEPVRTQRANAATLPLPDLKVGVAEFADRIVRLSAECRRRSLRCLFLTQPTFWRTDLTPGEKSLMWFGWMGPRDCAKGYVAVEQLADAMSLYNERLLETCRSHDLECFDLASVVPKNTSALFDDCHFNEAGARRVAESLASYLLAHPPFVQERAVRIAAEGRAANEN